MIITPDDPRNRPGAQQIREHDQQRERERERYATENQHRPWWWNNLMAVGPTTLAFGALLGAFLGWLPSPMLSTMSRIDQQLMSTGEVLADAQKTLASAQKTIAETAQAREARLEAMAAKIEAQNRALRVVCRNAARSPEANARCDDL